MIVDFGKPVRGLESARPARRTFAAVAANDRAALGFCSDITLADFATILVLPSATDFKIQRALNLPGGSPSAFWFARKRRQRVFDSRTKNGARFRRDRAAIGEIRPRILQIGEDFRH